MALYREADLRPLGCRVSRRRAQLGSPSFFLPPHVRSEDPPRVTQLSGGLKQAVIGGEEYAAEASERAEKIGFRGVLDLTRSDGTPLDQVVVQRFLPRSDERSALGRIGAARAKLSGSADGSAEQTAHSAASWSSGSVRAGPSVKPRVAGSRIDLGDSCSRRSRVFSTQQANANRSRRALPDPSRLP